MIYAIGDIHGQHTELLRVLSLIEADGGPEAEVVFIGDYTDRGPASAAVLDTLISGVAAGRNWHCLKGNHDRMFSWFMRDYPQHDAYLPVYLYWLHERLGGDTTMASYGVKMVETDRQTAVHALAKEAVPQAHVDFLEGLKLCHENDDLFFAHAGIQPGVPLDQQTEHDLLWIRKEFHVDTRDHGKLVVTGIPPLKWPRITATVSTLMRARDMVNHWLPWFLKVAIAGRLPIKGALRYCLLIQLSVSD